MSNTIGLTFNDPNYRDSCFKTCPAGYFGSKQSYTCVECDSSCRKCSGPSFNDCNSCDYGLYLVSSDLDSSLPFGKCITLCPKGTYKDEFKGECKECDSSCLECNGPTFKHCTLCKDEFFKNVTDFRIS